MLSGLLIVSMFQQFQEHPTYAAWDKNLGKSVHKHFPGWTLGVGGLLALASILPIIVVFILRVTGLSSPHVDYEPGSPMRRVETNASTHPMMVRYHIEINTGHTGIRYRQTRSASPPKDQPETDTETLRYRRSLSPQMLIPNQRPN